MNFIIYALCCPFCGCPRYVGQTSDFETRVQSHLKGDRKGDYSVHKKHWVQSLLNRGAKPLFVKLVELPSDEFLDDAEIYWIAELKRRGCKLTNLTDGGGGLRGYVYSEESKKKISESLKGRPVPQEVRDKISKTLTGRIGHNRGIPLSPLGKEAHAKAHAIPPFEDQHGRLYTTIKEACEAHGLSAPNVCNVLKRNRRSAGGLVFTYLHEKGLRKQEDIQRALDLEKQKLETKERDKKRSIEYRKKHKEHIARYMREYRRKNA